jgi:translation elongation factor EF-Ts
MSNITAADVNKLRKSTGAGIMDCKKALVEAKGDFELAIENLRKKGQKVAGLKFAHIATEIVMSELTFACGLCGNTNEPSYVSMEVQIL